MQPRDQRSAVWSYGFSSTSSGDMYSGVPLIDVSTKVETLMARANLQRDCITECRVYLSGNYWHNKLFSLKIISIYLPKVTQFHHSTFPQQYILWLHVSMENAMRVQIKQSRDQLAGDLTDLTGKEEEQMVIIWNSKSKSKLNDSMLELIYFIDNEMNKTNTCPNDHKNEYQIWSSARQILDRFIAYSLYVHSNICRIYLYLYFWYLSTFNVRYLKTFSQVLHVWVTLNFYQSYILTG